MTNPMDTPLRIDIISDVVCPWCVVGHAQLQQALAQTGITADLHWHPFELNPQMGPEGQDLREHITEKYGSTPEQSAAVRARLTALGQEFGFTFAFSDSSRIYNTFQAHQLIAWASETGFGPAMKQALFEAYFSRGEDVSDPEKLVEIAGRAGLDPARAGSVLSSGSHAKTVRSLQEFWAKHGITAVPAIVLDQSVLLVGAQGVETYVEALTQVQAARAAKT